MFRAFLAASALGLASASVADRFDEFVATYGKTYASPAERQERLSVFADNLQEIEAFNAAGKSTAVLGVGPFADLTAEEFAETMLMEPRAASDRDVPRPAEPVVAAADLPAAFDWTEQGAVTPVKDQGYAGSCWTFSSTGLFEGFYFLSGNALTSFSEEWIVECDASYDLDNNHADCGVFGGWNDLAVANVLEQGGLPLEADIPYCAGGGDKDAGIEACYPCTAGIAAPVYDDDWGGDDDDWYDDDDAGSSGSGGGDDDDDDSNIREELCGPSPSGCDMSVNDATCGNAQLTPLSGSWSMAPQNETALAQALVDNGPISILIDATGLQNYKGGLWEGKGVVGKCSDTGLDHAVLLTGFGTDSDFGDYWTVKNSWGTSWGEEGYFKAARGVGLCGLNTYAVQMEL